jgi:hypothetical protein
MGEEGQGKRLRWFLDINIAKKFEFAKQMQELGRAAGE